MRSALYEPDLLRFPRVVAERVFTRAAGAPLIGGNAVRVLRDGRENYAAWESAILAARKTVHLEIYIVHPDRTGRRFAALMAEKARSGVAVRVLYDWFGSMNGAAHGLFRDLRKAGVEARAVNPPGLSSVLGWASRDHRKLLTVDSMVGYVSGLCIGDPWLGDPERGVEPWRDTGIEVRGPAVADLEAAFSEMWAMTGKPVPADTLPERTSVPEAGTVALRVIPTSPSVGHVYRLDILVAALARRSLWLTDAYFLITPPYAQALESAANDGVDVRLLVPHRSDVPWIATLSRAHYRRLLEAGMRVFEWNGSMVHAKTAVADGLWTRIGSTNLNLASWLANWELDVAVEDPEVASGMEALFLKDLSNTTEVVFTSRHRIGFREAPPPRPRAPRFSSGLRRGAEGTAWLGSALGVAVRGNRPLEPAESAALAASGLVLLAVAAFSLFFPLALVLPLAGVSAWTGLVVLWRAWRVWRSGADD